MRWPGPPHPLQPAVSPLVVVVVVVVGHQVQCHALIFARCPRLISCNHSYAQRMRVMERYGNCCRVSMMHLHIRVWCNTRHLETAQLLLSRFFMIEVGKWLPSNQDSDGKGIGSIYSKFMLFVVQSP